MSRNRITILLLLLIPLPVCGQQDLRQSFDDFSRSCAALYEKFSEDANREFSETIRQQWESFILFDAEARLQIPKPDSMSIAGEPENLEVQIATEGVPIETLGRRKVNDCNTAGGLNAGEGTVACTIDFYGVKVDVPVPEKYLNIHPAGIKEQDVGDFWEELCGCNHKTTFLFFERYKSQHHLNDWISYEWVKALAKAVFPENINCEQEIFTVFFVNQIGLCGRIGRAGDKLVCLFASSQKIYARKFINIDGLRYYLAEGDADSSCLYTYSIDIKCKKSPFDLRICEQPLLGRDFVTKTMYSHCFKSELNVPVNTGNLLLYSGYPQTDVNVYALSDPGEMFSKAIIRSIHPMLEGKPELECLNLLLSFLHKDFRYKTDTDQFGYEKPFFCEENFYYPHNDCEDRAVLFSFLVRNLLGKSTVLVEYPGHIACAVKTAEPVKGYYIRIGDSKYYICDPTYLGAKVGMSCMDRTVKPKKIWVIS